MKQKYVVLMDSERGKLSIQEYAELDKEMLSLLCEETYDIEAVKAAMQKDRSALIAALRTHNMYPPGAYTERIADAIVEMFQPGANTSAELFFEEKELFEGNAEEEEIEADEDEDEGSMDVDELLDEDIEDDFEDKGIIKDLQKSIKMNKNEESGIDES